jgi:hypothetical protein
MFYESRRDLWRKSSSIDSASAKEDAPSGPRYTVGVGHHTLYYTEEGWQLSFATEGLDGPGMGIIHVNARPLFPWDWYDREIKETKPLLESDLLRVLKNMKAASTAQHYQWVFYRPRVGRGR